MTGSKRRRKGNNSPSKNASTAGNVEREVSPKLPTSGQILGVLVRSLGISHPSLGDKTAQRYFSGRLENRVKESSRDNIIAAISETLAESIFVGTPVREGEGHSNSSWLAEVLNWHAANWDRFRAFLHPRMMRVYPSHLASIWRAYIRLVAVDLALRAATHIHLSGASSDALEFLDWAGVGRRGEFLNKNRRAAGVSIDALAEAADVSRNAVEAWLYQGARPSDNNLASIVAAFVSDADSDEYYHLLRQLRMLYWVSDVAGLLGEIIGPDSVDEAISRLHRYASQLCIIMGIVDEMDATRRWDVLSSIATLGAHSSFSEALLAFLVSNEADVEWKKDLTAVASDWTRRVLEINLDVHRAEVDDLILQTEGQILKNWDVGNPEAYAHYQRSMELQVQGRMREAVAEVARAAELDPLDPANHFTLGSVKGGIGAQQGDAALIEEGIEECWLAATLDPVWILPWAEIGLILFSSGRPKEAVAHLKAVEPERRPLDTRYYSTLGLALRELGRYEESLTAFESCLELNPDDLLMVIVSTVTAALAGNKAKLRQYAKMARHMGASKELDDLLHGIKMAKAAAQRARNGAGQRPKIRRF